jgi:uncharacterized protein YlxW (UPF0749 family)
VDALLAAILQAAPSWGVGGLLIAYVVILIRREARVDATHSTALERQDRLHAAELERLNRDHDAELAELNGKIRQLRTDLDDLDRLLSAQRKARLELPARVVDEDRP